MMNENTQDAAAKRLLEALADINRLLRDHAVELRRSSAATHAQAYLEAVSYKSGPVLEGYVDATLANGDVVCWCLDARWDQNSWTIEATLDRRGGDRQDTVAELPTETATDLDAFLGMLKRVAGELLALRIPEAGIGRRK
jgi:hypothetical protein